MQQVDHGFTKRVRALSTVCLTFILGQSLFYFQFWFDRRFHDWSMNFDVNYYVFVVWILFLYAKIGARFPRPCSSRSFRQTRQIGSHPRSYRRHHGIWRPYESKFRTYLRRFRRYPVERRLERWKTRRIRLLFLVGAWWKHARWSDLSWMQQRCHVLLPQGYMFFIFNDFFFENIFFMNN